MIYNVSKSRNITITLIGLEIGLFVQLEDSFGANLYYKRFKISCKSKYLGYTFININIC